MKTSCYSVKTVGRYQWCLLTPYTIAVIFCHWANLGILVIAPKLRFRCTDYAPSFQNLTLAEQLRLMPENQCMQPAIGRESSEELRQMNRSDFELKKCENFLYDHTYFDFTATEQFDLVCNRKWVIPMTATVYMIGFFFAAISSGTISDRFGRKTATIGSCIVAFVANMVSAYSPYMELFLAARFFVAVGDISTYTCGLVLTTELLRKDQRIIAKVMASTFGSFGNASIGLFAMWFRDSRHQQTMTAMMFLLTAILLWFLAVESPRWLAAENRPEDAEEVVHYIAQVNGLNQSDLSHLHSTTEEKEKRPTAGAASILDLFRTPLMRKRTLLMTFMWFSLVFVYYALTYNLGSFYPDVRISLMISGAMELACIILAILTIDRMGRSFTSFLYMLLAGICCFCMIPLVEQQGSAALLSLALIGKMLAGNQFFIIYITTQEMFPTVCRNMGLGCCSSVARIAGMLAPQVVLLNAYWPATSVLILGVFGVVGGLLAPLLPDTTGIELPQTLIEGENFIKDHTYSLRWPTRERMNEVNRRHACGTAARDELNRAIIINGDLGPDAEKDTAT